MAHPPADDLLERHLHAVADGDVAGLHALYEATSRRLFVVCLGIVRNREAAEDVLQEVYLKVWNRAAGFDSQRGSPWPWLVMIARNAAIDWTRARTRRQSLDAPKYLVSREEEVAERPVDEQLAQAQEGERALQAMDHLDEAAAMCLRAAFMEGLSYSEVAEREGLPLGTVKSRIRRALKQMREQMSNG